jgi:hypothetical protein
LETEAMHRNAIYPARIEFNLGFESGVPETAFGIGAFLETSRREWKSLVSNPSRVDHYERAIGLINREKRVNFTKPDKPPRLIRFERHLCIARYDGCTGRRNTRVIVHPSGMIGGQTQTRFFESRNSKYSSGQRMESI